MKEYTITGNDKGIKLSKYLGRILPAAGQSFIYKMLRKKNITLNDKKASGNEILCTDDSIKIYFSDDTFEKFSCGKEDIVSDNLSNAFKELPPIVYEDDNILILNKPAGMLSQKSHEEDISLNEICLSYLLSKGEISSDSLKMYKPSIVNRLDRNTMGLVVFAKTYNAANQLSKAFKERTVHKYYRCIVVGKIDEEMLLSGSLLKDTDKNIVTIINDGQENIKTKITPLKSNENYSLLEVLLITGKTHQIRAHLASISHPIVGDVKYGNKDVNDVLYKKYKLKHQLLVSYRIVFPEFTEELQSISKKEFTIKTPAIFERLI